MLRLNVLNRGGSVEEASFRKKAYGWAYASLALILCLLWFASTNPLGTAEVSSVFKRSEASNTTITVCTSSLMS